MSIDEKAMDAACAAYEIAQIEDKSMYARVKSCIEAYEAAKVAEQPVVLSVQEIAEVLCTADTDEHGIDDWKNYKHMAEAIAPFLHCAPKRESVAIQALRVIAREEDDRLHFDAQSYAQEALSKIEGGKP